MKEKNVVVPSVLPINHCLNTKGRLLYDANVGYVSVLLKSRNAGTTFLDVYKRLEMIYSENAVLRQDEIWSG